MSHQDILGQLPLLKSYTHILLCFALPDSQREPVLQALKDATGRLLSAFPFLAGHVVHKDVRPGHSGHFTVLTEPPRTETQILRIVDLSPFLPTYTTLSNANAPSIMLPGSLLAPARPAFPHTYSSSSTSDGEGKEGNPVLEIQTTLLENGFLLDLAAQHNIIDATGIFYIANVLARILNGHPDPIPTADILLGNCDRRTLIPLLPDNEPLPPALQAFTPGSLPPPLGREALGQYRWFWLHFSPRAIRDIHEDANRVPGDFPESISRVSVNDALTAFCWKRITLVRHRLTHGSDNHGTGTEGGGWTQATRAADLRRTMNLSPAYMGHMVRTANLRLPVSTVISSSLSSLAGLLRQCVADHTTPYAVRSYATLLAREEDKSRIAYAGFFDPRTDFSCSSVAHVKVPVFGALGKPEFIRRPTFGPLPSGMYIGPGRRGEGLDAVVCLLKGEMEALRGDGEWMGRVEFVG